MLKTITPVCFVRNGEYQGEEGSKQGATNKGGYGRLGGRETKTSESAKTR